jgi:hypothetical protein
MTKVLQHGASGARLADMTADLVVVLDAGADSDAEELADLTRRLRTELLDLDIDSVEHVAGGVAPEGAKGVELLSIGGLVVQFVRGADVLRSVVSTTAAWLRRQEARSVKLTLDGDTLEVTGLSSEEQSGLIEVWVARHARDG